MMYQQRATTILEIETILDDIKDYYDLDLSPKLDEDSGEGDNGGVGSMELSGEQ